MSEGKNIVDPEAREKAKKTQETFAVHKHIVACNDCGSTAVGLQGAGTPDVIVCDSCGNTMRWNGAKFTLIRYVQQHQVETAVGIERALSETEREAEKRAKEKEIS